ncbi:AbrB/MazE/SpoVT family DNA-binding domain-containing protein [Pontiellaceae bacterium B12227]|nr:AbrB/MazE/SpoVT family DNA-binding domain-containing protein [Pontiellaceae bacterium B12227]
MQMKVFNKGQVVIPAAIRKELGLNVGDMLDVQLNTANSCIELKKADSATEHLAGSLSSYAKGKNFPSRKQMHDAFAKGMSNET